MTGVESSLYSTAFAVCAFAAGLLRRRRDAPAVAAPGVPAFLGVVAFGFVCEVLMAHPAAPLKSLWLGLRLTSSLLLAPVLWLALRERVEGTRFAWTELGRSAGMVLAAGAALNAPLIAQAHGGVTYINPAAPVDPATGFLIHAGMLGCVAMFAVQCPIYLKRCQTLLRLQRHRSLADGGAGANDSNWLHLPLLMVAVTWSLGLLRTLQCLLLPAHLESAVIFALAEVPVIIGAVWLITRRAAPPPPIADGDGAPAVAPTEPVPASPTAAPASGAEAQYARSPLDPVLRSRIKRKLTQALDDDAVYTDSLISLRSLSAALKENPRHVSQVISQDLGSSFYELINQHRIEEAKRRLRHSPNATALEIALAVGFNSKSTFNTAFRRYTGTTPTGFRAAAEAGSPVSPARERESSDL